MDLELRTLILETLAWELRLGGVGLGTLAQELELGTFSLGTSWPWLACLHGWAGWLG